MKAKAKAKKRPAKTKFNDDVYKRSITASRHPEVKEFDSLCAEAVRLAGRMRKWLQLNDTPDDTAGMVAFDVALKSNWHDGTNLPEFLFHFRGMHWGLEAATEHLDSWDHPDQFPKLDAALRMR